MAKYIQKPFAINGDITEIPTETTLNGAVSFQQGYTQYYELDPATDPLAQRIERSKMNYLFNAITANTKEWQEQTFPAWISDSGSGTPFGYQIGAIVKYTDGKFYQSLTDDNTEPPTNNTNWQEFKPLITTPANVILATLNTAIGVVALGTQFYCSANKNTYILIQNTSVTAETTLQELINNNYVQNTTYTQLAPNWNAVIAISFPYTVPSTGWISTTIQATNSNVLGKLMINNIEICCCFGSPGHWQNNGNLFAPVFKGDIITVSGGIEYKYKYFIPAKGNI